MSWIKKRAEEEEKFHWKPKVFVVGCTNVGKSSIINALIHKMSNNPRIRDTEKDVYNWEKRSENEAHRKSKDVEMDGLLKNSKRSSTIIQQLLTVSPLPGTTMDFVKIDDLHMGGVKVFDTPGVP